VKVAIDRNGVLTVQSETQLESYAIQKWSEGVKNIPDKMCVCWDDQHLIEIFKEEKKNG
jgi:hypothetical protein